jgi:peptidyl-prolyl cis-trans isomerase C
MPRFRLYPAVSLLRRILVASLLGLPLIAAASAQTPAPTPAQTPAPAPAQTPAPAPPQPAGAAAAAADPVVASVDGQPIHLSDLQAAVQTLPADARNMPTATLFPMLLEQLIDGRALVIEARTAGLPDDPTIHHQMDEAANRVLQTAMLSRVVGPAVTDDAVRARYQRDIASKPGEDEVHARHILVDNEDLAKKIIAQLKQGGDFAALAKQYSKDPGADHSGDLGFFRKDEMVPEFAAAAFAMQPNQISDTPVHTQFGWHIIQVLDRRKAPVPTFEDARNGLRQKMIQEGIQQAVAEARAKVKVETFNLDGSTPRATDTAEPPPAVKP